MAGGRKISKPAAEKKATGQWLSVRTIQLLEGVERYPEEGDSMRGSSGALVAGGWKQIHAGPLQQKKKKGRRLWGGRGERMTTT